ncbi:hypothetical protein QBC43DRAFT_309904 [Cladorrhinum sp. PSN259]|nr:hypothetical protein QBC43DRAFT_309904 [Cladorrhinum sp. PSN259]
MGRDIYCAICNGPFRDVEFSRPESGKEDVWPREYYDPSFIRKRETKWLRHVMVLAFYHDVGYLRRTHIATHGYQTDSGVIEAEEDVPEVERIINGYEGVFNPYATGHTTSSDKDPSYPFHAECFRIFLLLWRGDPEGGHESGPDKGDQNDAQDDGSGHDANGGNSGEQDGRDNEEPARVSISGSDADPDEERYDDYPDTSEIDTDVLYGVMRELDLKGNRQGRYRLALDYGNTWRNDGYGSQYWECHAGEEVLVADPAKVDGLYEHIRHLMASEYSQAPESSSHDLTKKVQRDPFKKLPVEILSKVAWCLEDIEDLVNLGKASWYAILFLRGASNMFWRGMVGLQTEWFEELRAAVIHQTDLTNVSMRAVYLWANSNTRAVSKTPRRKGLIRVANRRRIYNVCRELADCCKRKRISEDLEYGNEASTEFEEFLCFNAHSPYMPIITDDLEDLMYGGVQTQFFVRNWEETYEKAQWVEIFFHPISKFLSGIAISSMEDENEVPDDNERRLQTLGSRLGDPKTGLIPKDDWICGFILHIGTEKHPGPQYPHARQLQETLTSPKGVTILCNSGLKLEFGETTNGHPLRVLVCRPMTWESQAVGIMAQMNLTVPGYDNLTAFTRLGLVRVYDADMEERRCMSSWINETRNDDCILDSLLWKEDYSQVLGVPIWNHPVLEFHAYDGGSFSRHNELGVLGKDAARRVRQDLVVQEALFWATCKDDAKKLTRLSIYSRLIDDSGNYANKEDWKRKYAICGFEVQVVSGEKRTVGKTPNGPWTQVPESFQAGPTVIGTVTQLWKSLRLEEGETASYRVDMEIDGAGGESISAISCMGKKELYNYPYPRYFGLEMSTGHGGGVFSFVSDGDVPEEHIFSTTGSTDIIAGILVTFDDKDRLCALAAITIGPC